MRILPRPEAAIVRHKHFLRRHFQEAVRRLPPVLRRRRAAAAARRLARLPEFRRAETVAVYLSLPHEADTAPLIALCRQAGKRLRVPVVDPAKRSLRFASWAGGRTVPNVYGIPEPAALRDAPTGPIDLLVVPGAAFTPRGDRLGSGGGYYDRILKGRSRPPAVGWALEEQLAVWLPRAPHDAPVDIVVTPARVFRR